MALLTRRPPSHPARSGVALPKQRNPFFEQRHRTTRTRNCVSHSTFLGLAFKLIESAEQSSLCIRSADKIAPLLQGIPFKNEVPVIDSTPDQQALAAR